MNYDILTEVLLLMAVAVGAVAAFRKLNLPPILAYLFVGLLLGPYGWGWVDDGGTIRLLAEIGVVFLMFTVGLEFSLPQLMAMRKEVFGLGGAQVVLTTLGTGMVAMWLGLGVEASLIIGGVFALSSTAIVIKQLNEQFELHTAHGRHAVGILLFQDLAVVPFLIIIPALAGSSEQSFFDAMFFAMLKGTVVLLALVAIGHWLLRPFFHLVASLHSAELFTMTVLLCALAAAWVTHFFGLSLALGAFIAGMMLGETEYRHQVETDIRPFRDVLLGLFFITIGMLINVHILPDIIHWVLLVLVGVMMFKTLLIMALSTLMGEEKGVALRTGLVLNQCGEFGFALISLAVFHELFDISDSQVILGAVVLSMIIAPPMIRSNRLIAKSIFEYGYGPGAENVVQTVAEDTGTIKNHVLICGYGRVGQNIAWFVETEGFPYIALDLDPVRVREARAAGESVSYGDCTHREILLAARIEQARIVVITVDQPSFTEKVLHEVKSLAPSTPVIVRAIDESHLDQFQQAGADAVVPEKLEASLMLASHTLMLLGIPAEEVMDDVQEVRMGRYELMRKYFRGHEAIGVDESDLSREGLHSITLDEGDFAVGKSLGDLDLDSFDVQVDTLRIDGIRASAPTDETVVKVGDVIVLYGKPDALERAEAHLLIG